MSRDNKYRIFRFTRITQTSSRIGLSEIEFLIIVAIMMACIWGFIELSDKVMEMETQRFDQWAIRILRDSDDTSRPVGPKWVMVAAHNVTALGGFTVLGGLVTVMGGYFIIKGHYISAILIFVIFVGGLLGIFILKLMFFRARPDIDHLVYVASYGFPSGHAMVSAIIYPALWAMLSPAGTHRRIKIYWLSIIMLLIFLIGLSRIYLGVHYPTDIIAGWMAGTVGALSCFMAVRYLQKRNLN